MPKYTTSSNSGEPTAPVSLPVEPWAQRPGDPAPVPDDDPLAKAVAHAATVAAGAFEHFAQRLRKVAASPGDIEAVVELLLEPSRAAEASIEGLRQEELIPTGTQYGASERWKRMVNI